MRRVIVGALLGAGLVFAVTGERGALGPAFGQQSAYLPQQFPGNDLMMHVTAPADGQPLTITVIDSRERWIGIYQVEQASGEIKLASARKIAWDTQLIEFNSGKPLPQDIRNGLPP